MGFKYRFYYRDEHIHDIAAGNIDEALVLFRRIYPEVHITKIEKTEE